MQYARWACPGYEGPELPLVQDLRTDEGLIKFDYHPTPERRVPASGPKTVSHYGR